MEAGEREEEKRREGAEALAAAAAEFAAAAAAAAAETSHTLDSQMLQVCPGSSSEAAGLRG